MNKTEFIMNLTEKLPTLPREELEDRVNFYIEMIDDRMEEGFSEEDAVSSVGSVEEIATQIIADIPFAVIAKEKIKPKRRLNVWEIVLLVLGSPIWLSLLIAAFAVVLSLYAALWSVIISLWAVFVSLACCAPCGVAAGIVLAISGNGLTAIATVGAGIVCAGLAIFLFFGCKAATKGTLLLTKNITIGIKNSFIKKEEA